MAPFTYAVLGLLALATPGYEVFPFFSWFLFPITPATVTRFAVKVERGKQSPTSTWFEDDKMLGDGRHSMEAQMLIQALGNAVQLEDAIAVRRIRSTFEANFLTQPCHYSLAKRTYDPLERWATRGDGEDVVITAFECGQP